LNRLELLSQLVRSFYTNNDPAHDWNHISRVIANAKKIAIAENQDPELIVAAVYCHDLVNLQKNHPERKNASVLSAKTAEPLLHQSGFKTEEIQIISYGIIEHSFSLGKSPPSKIAAIVQDADRLDALGAIGILRCAAVNSKMNALFYDSTDPLAKERQLDDKTFMLDHYFVKLFKLPELMNTKKAKEMAIERIQVMEGFIEKLLLEISSCG